MPSKKTTSRKKTKPAPPKKNSARTGTRHASTLNADAINAIAEQLEMMLPEVMSRIAAVEHLMVEKGVCTHADLRRARQFIDEQESW